MSSVKRSVVCVLTMVAFRLLMPLCSGSPASEQTPEIARNGVVNAASNTPSALAGNRIARGGLLTITGSRLTSASAGSTVNLSGSWGSTSLTIVSASFNKISARIPPGVSLGPAALTVSADRQSSSPFPVKIVSSQFGIFSLNGKGWGPGQIDNVASSGTRSQNSASNPALLGQSLVLTGTGLGDASRPEVYVAGLAAKILTVNRASAARAGDQIAFKLPANAPEGCFVPVQVRHAGERPSNIVTISIHGGGGACRPPGHFPFAGWAGSRAGLVVVSRTVSSAFTFESIVDKVDGSFVELPKEAKLNPYVLLPPPGSCTMQVESRAEEVAPSQIIPLLTSHSSPNFLDAGAAFSIDDGKLLRKASPVRGVRGVYSGDLTNYHRAGAAPALQRFLSPADLHIIGAGGSNVGRFQFSLRGPEPFALVPADSRLNRARGLTVEWSGIATDRFAIIVATFVDPSSDTRGMCYCVAAPGASSFNIPPGYLAYFPGGSKTSDQIAPARGSLVVVAWPVHPVSFQAPGLDHGFAASVYVRAARLDFR